MGVYYIYQNFPFKSWEDFTNYVYSGKHLENHVEKSEEQNKEDKMKKHLEIYIDAARTIANGKNIEFIELQKVFEDYLISNDVYSMTLSADRVHPNLTGHMIIAKAWLNNFFEVEVK